MVAFILTDELGNITDVVVVNSPWEPGVFAALQNRAQKLGWTVQTKNTSTVDEAVETMDEIIAEQYEPHGEV